MLISKIQLRRAVRKLSTVADLDDGREIAQLRIHARMGVLTLGAKNERTSATCHLSCAEGELSGSVSLPDLLAFLKPCERSEHGSIVELQSAANGQVIIAAKGKFMMASPAACSEAAAQDDVGFTKEARWTAGQIASALDFVLPVISENTGRAFASGVRFEASRLVATDGRRIHVVNLEGPRHAPVFIDRVALTLLRRIVGRKGQVHMRRGSSSVRFETGDWTIDTLPLEIAFPPVDHVIPADGHGRTSVEVDGELVSSLAKSLPKPGRHQKRHLKVTVNGELAIATTWHSGPARSLAVPLLSGDHAADALTVGINVNYLVDAVSAPSGRVRMSFAGPLDPILVSSSPNRLAVVMPTKL